MDKSTIHIEKTILGLFLTVCPRFVDITLHRKSKNRINLVTARNTSRLEIIQQLPDDSTFFPDFSYPYNIKITFPHDIQIAEILINER